MNSTPTEAAREITCRFWGHPSMRPFQPEMMDIVGSFMGGNKIVLILSASPGIGKEAVIISSMLTAFETKTINRAIIIVPIGSARINKMKELNAITHDKKVVELKSKDIMCRWIKDKHDERIKAIQDEKCGYELCKLARNKCPYNENGCPYYEQKKEAMDADIIICDYNYVLSPFIRERFGINKWMEGNTVGLFVDECHKVPDRLYSIYSRQLSSRTLNHAIEELEEYGYKKLIPIVQNLKDAVDSEVDIHHKEMKAEIEEHKLEDTPNPINYRTLDDVIDNKSALKITAAGEAIKNYKFEHDEGIISFAGYVGNFMSAFLTSKEYKIKYDKYIYYIKLKEDLVNSSVGWQPNTIYTEIRAAMKGFEKIVYYSGTCIPDKFAMTLGMNTKEWAGKIMAPDRFKSPFLKYRKDIIYTKLKFLAKYRSKPTIMGRYRKELTELIERMPKPLAIVCTRKWLEALNFEFEIFMEPKNQEDVEKWILIDAPGKPIVYFSPHGRLAQSVDLPFLNSIIIIGTPFKQINKITEARVRSFEKRLKGFETQRKWIASYILYTLPMMETVIQSAMRGLRGERNEFTVVYCDPSYRNHKALFGSDSQEIIEKRDDMVARLERIHLDEPINTITTPENKEETPKDI